MSKLKLLPEARALQTPTVFDAATHESVLPAASLTRRALLRHGLLAGGLLALGTGGYAYGIEPVWPEITFCRMVLPGLAPAFHGTRLIQISDLHVGSTVELDYLQGWVDWVSRQEADFVVVTGDTLHSGRFEAAEHAARLLRGLRARQTVLAILGNHEWCASRPRHGLSGAAERSSQALRSGDVQLLRNESVCLRRDGAELHVVGLDDYWGDRFDPGAAFARVPAGRPVIVLSHNPDSAMAMLDRPWHWMLSGHTHGGQVRLPLLGPPMLPVVNRQFVAGHYPVGGKNLYVNRGLGWLVRVRLMARPEITVFTLETA